MTQEFSGPASGGSKYDGIPPTLDELGEIAEDYGMHLSPDELRVFAEVIKGTPAAYKRVAALPEPKPEVKYPRTPGYRSPPDENPLNDWYWRCSVKGASEGKLAGKKIALKDNICVVGVPMTNGSAIVEGFVPDIDATVDTRRGVNPDEERGAAAGRAASGVLRVGLKALTSWFRTPGSFRSRTPSESLNGRCSRLDLSRE